MSPAVSVTFGAEPHPFVKAVGGKRRLLPELLKRAPASFGAYHEPFVGGGALFFKLRAMGFDGYAYLSDVNRDLIACYHELKARPDDLIRRLKYMAKRNSEKFFYKLRAIDVDEIPVDAPGKQSGIAARYMYLNKTAFNGLHRVNRAGKMNAPWGHYDKPSICDEPNLRAVSRALQKTSIGHRDFESKADVIRSGDFWYADPVYYPVKRTSFTAYAAGGFGHLDHVRLAAHARMLKARGVHVMLSNSDTPEVRELYADFRIEEVLAARSINRDGGGRGKVTELLIT